MRKFLIQVLVGVILLVIGTFIGIAVEKYKTKMRFLDATIFKAENLLPLESLLGKDAEIVIKGRKVKNISTVFISLFNKTDKDFADVPIFINLIPKDGTTLDILNQEIVAPNELPEAIEVIQGVSQLNVKGAKRFGYLIKNANRSVTGDTDDTILFIRFSFAGGKAPEVKVATDKLGLGLHISPLFGEKEK